MIPATCTDLAVPSWRWARPTDVQAMMTCATEQGHRQPDHPWSADRGRGEVPPGGERREAGRGHHARLPGGVMQPAAVGVERYEAVAQPCPYPRRRSPMAVLARARVLARSAACARVRSALRGRFRHGISAHAHARVGRRRRVRGRDPSRQWRVSRDRRPLVARVAAENGLPDCRGRSRCPTVGPSPDSSKFCVEFREAGTFAVSDLSALLHIITHHNKPTRPRRGHGRVPARSSAAPRCRSAASPP